MEKKIEQKYFASKGYRVINTLKVHEGKRYTFLLTKNKKAYIGKLHLAQYLLSQAIVHYGINVLAYPDKTFIQGSGILIPELIERYYLFDDCITIFEYIEGQSLESFYVSKSDTHYIDDIVNVFMLFLSFESEITFFGPIGNKIAYKSWEDFTTSYFKEKLDKLPAGLLEPRTLICLYNLLPQAFCVSNKNLVHYDLSISNLMLNKSGLLVVIDWDGYYIGDAIYSIAKFLYYLYTNELFMLYDSLMLKLADLVPTQELYQYLAFVCIEKISVMNKYGYIERYNRDIHHLQTIINTLGL